MGCRLLTFGTALAPLGLAFVTGVLVWVGIIVVTVSYGLPAIRVLPWLGFATGFGVTAVVGYRVVRRSGRNRRYAIVFSLLALLGVMVATPGLLVIDALRGVSPDGGGLAAAYFFVALGTVLLGGTLFTVSFPAAVGYWLRALDRRAPGDPARNRAKRVP